MPYYAPLKRESPTYRKRIVRGLQRIRKQFEDENFPHKKASDSLILGTWNIRNFDDNRFGFGPRSLESMYYLAEIISHFDVIAVQEICEDLYPLKRLVRMMDVDRYDYIVTDVTHEKLGGNRERLGFIYDKHKVNFTGVAGEIVLPEELKITEIKNKPSSQFSRTPFGVEFQSGWFKFTFSTVHIYYGDDKKNKEKYKRRVDEIDKVAKYLKQVADKSNTNHILVGDFNIEDVKSKNSKKAAKELPATYNALVSNGFTTVQNRKGSNMDQTKFYDQISFRRRKNELELIEPKREDRVFQFFNSVYRYEDIYTYRSVFKNRLIVSIKEKEANLAKDKKKLADMSSTERSEKYKNGETREQRVNKKISKTTEQINLLTKALKLIDGKKLKELVAETFPPDSDTANAKKVTNALSKEFKYLIDQYKKWRTFQMSDHLPLWVEIKIDFTDRYLNYLLQYKPKSK